MNKNILTILGFLSLAASSYSQSYAPAAGQPGSTAIHKDSSVFEAWATACIIERGWMNIEQPELGYASFGTEQDALGPAEGFSTTAVSLGDGGSATLTFDVKIINGEGPDFAVFENGVTDGFLELAFVEVSSNGIDFVRFPATSEIPIAPQIGSFGIIDCRYIHNFAGKYRAGFGTPFDLEDLIDSTQVDINAITHIRIVDVIGSTDPQYATYDSKGNIVNNIHPTPFESGGFDLDGIGVIHSTPLSIGSAQNPAVRLYPNPATSILNIATDHLQELKIVTTTGRIIMEVALEDTTNKIDVSHLPNGIYFVQSSNGLPVRFVKQ